MADQTKSTLRSRIGILGLSLVTALTLVGLAAAPAQAADTDVATFTELQAATTCTAGVGAPDEVTLTADISAGTDQLVVTCHVVLDLAGHALAVRNVVINTGQALTIDDSGGTGSLTADASSATDHVAGIQNTGATLTINAGTITAVSGPDLRYAQTGAGIGGSGQSSGAGGPGGTTIINGGVVNADGGNGSAGIGGSAKAAGGTTTINGGTVTALGGKYGAGIGGGDMAVGGTTTINGGTVVATGTDGGSGIGGGGYGGPGGTTTIHGGTVTANGSFGGAGIGGGVDGGGGTTTVHGGTVTANGSVGGAGIGGGAARPGGTTTISAGTVIAVGGDGAAGIGGGRAAAGGTTRVQGGSVTAAGGHTAVGGGVGSTSFGTLEVSGGVLRVPTGALVVPDSAGPEVTLGAGGVIDGSAGPTPTYATISGNGDIVNGGSIRLPTANVTGVSVTDHHYLVSFDTQGGSVAPGSVTVYAESFADGARPFPADPTRTGYEFAGWNSAADGSGVPISQSSTLPGASADGTAVPVTAYAQWTVPVDPVPVVPVTLPQPTITGVPRVGERLTAQVAPTVPRSASLAYQWLRTTPAGVLSPIAGASGPTYLLGPDDLGRRISVRVTATAAGYDPATATAVSSTVQPGTIALPKPVLRGKATKGKRLSVRLDTPDISGLNLRYRWRAGGRLLDATSASMRLSRRTVGKHVRVIVTATAPGYRPVTVRSRSTPRVAPAR